MVEVIELKKQIKSGDKGSKPQKIKIETSPKETQTPEPPRQETSSTDSTTQVKEKVHSEGSETNSKTKADSISPDNYENGFSYLIEENRANFCFEIFSKLTTTNEKGLCICRINPAIILRKYNFIQGITMLWLTDRESSKEATISPSLESMIYVVEEFIDKNEEAVILLDGIEYLISNNGFNPVLRFIRRLIDKISETSTILLIGVSSKAMNEQELKLLERELNPIFFN